VVAGGLQVPVATGYKVNWKVYGMWWRAVVEGAWCAVRRCASTATRVRWWQWAGGGSGGKGQWRQEKAG